MVSNRQAMIGEDHCKASSDESVEAFHARLWKIGRDREAWMVQLGHPSNALREIPGSEVFASEAPAREEDPAG
jgi:hypothetical protein